MENLDRPSQARSRFRVLLLVWVLAILTMHLWAQDQDDADDDDDEPSGTFASLTLKYDERGKADATFFSYGDVQNWKGIEAELEQALRCPAGVIGDPATEIRSSRSILLPDLRKSGSGIGNIWKRPGSTRSRASARRG